MMTIKINALKVVMVATLLAITCNGCKKDDGQLSEVTVQNDVDINALKAYFADLLRTDPSKVSYDPDQKIFIVKGVGYMSLEDLTNVYKTSPINHYRNDVPVKP